METHSDGNPEARTVERGRQNPRWRPAAATAKKNNNNILSRKLCKTQLKWESSSFTSIITTTTTARKAARVTYQSQCQTREQRDQAEDDIRAPNRNAKLVRHVVVATLENTRGAIKGGKIKRQTECVQRLIYEVIFQPHRGSYTLFNLQGGQTERTSRLTRMNMESLNSADIEFILWNNKGDRG